MEQYLPTDEEFEDEEFDGEEESDCSEEEESAIELVDVFYFDSDSDDTEFINTNEGGETTSCMCICKKSNNSSCCCKYQICETCYEQNQNEGNYVFNLYTRTQHTETKKTWILYLIKKTLLYMCNLITDTEQQVSTFWYRYFELWKVFIRIIIHSQNIMNHNDDDREKLRNWDATFNEKLNESITKERFKEIMVDWVKKVSKIRSRVSKF